MAHSSVTIQITPQSVPSIPSWMGEVAAVAQVLCHVGILKAIEQRVQFARVRFGHYDVIDFAVVLIGYALSGEPTLKAFYERLLPFGGAFMALFGRDRLPDRSTLSRFLAALDQAALEALRTLFQEDKFNFGALQHPLWIERRNKGVAHEVIERRGNFPLVQSAVAHNDIDAALAIGADPIERLDDCFDHSLSQIRLFFYELRGGQ